MNTSKKIEAAMSKVPVLPAPECLNPDGHVWTAWGISQNVRRPGWFWFRDRYDVYTARTCRMCGVPQFYRAYSYKV